MLGLSGCGRTSKAEPTPEGAKDFLKLRGYGFSEKAFLEATGAGDVLAVNAFLLAGINPNARDEDEGDTALISAATAGNLEMVNALLKGGADASYCRKA